MSAYDPKQDFSNYSAEQLQQAAQRVSTDLANLSQIGTLRPEYVEQQQDLKTYLTNEAGRRNG